LAVHTCNYNIYISLRWEGGLRDEISANGGPEALHHDDELKKILHAKNCLNGAAGRKRLHVLFNFFAIEKNMAKNVKR
jgi:hypothetical protein